MNKIVIFASGAGSNARKIIEFFFCSSQVEVVAVFCNNPGAGVITIAENHKIPVVLFDRSEMKSGVLQQKLDHINPDLIILAGFLWLVPADIVDAYPNRIINIHPALLPRYGGKGMYGMHVHQAVYDNKEPKTGITIHYVNRNYDEGDIIFQAETDITAEDTPQTIARKVHVLEHRHYPEVIRDLLAQK